jgi:hypothetical protein
MNLSVYFASAGLGGDRKPVSVPRPSAHAGIGAALRQAFAAPCLPEEFTRLLAKLK